MVDIVVDDDDPLPSPPPPIAPDRSASRSLDTTSNLPRRRPSFRELRSIAVAWVGGLLSLVFGIPPSLGRVGDVVDLAREGPTTTSSWSVWGMTEIRVRNSRCKCSCRERCAVDFDVGLDLVGVVDGMTHGDMSVGAAASIMMWAPRTIEALPFNFNI